LTNSTTLGLTTSGPIATGKINHVVIIVQENRSPDNLFHDPILIAAGRHRQPGLTSSGAMVPITPVTLVTNYDLDHTHAAFLDVCGYDPASNSCQMNTADLNTCGPSQNCPAYPEYQYVDNSTG